MQNRMLKGCARHMGTTPQILKRAGVLGVLALGLTTGLPSVAAAAPIPLADHRAGHTNGGGNGNGNGGGLPSAAETPELSSVLLFGAGAAGMAGYARTRFLASRRRTPQDEGNAAP